MGNKKESMFLSACVEDDIDDAWAAMEADQNAEESSEANVEDERGHAVGSGALHTNPYRGHASSIAWQRTKEAVSGQVGGFGGTAFRAQMVRGRWLCCFGLQST